MRHTPALLFCLLTALPLAAQSNCAKHQKTENALIELERVWAKAYDTRDLATMSCLLAPEYHHTAYDGKVMNRAEALAKLEGLGNDDPINHEVEHVKASLFGDVAVVFGDDRASEPSGKLLGITRFTDVFVYRDGRWQAVAEHESRVAQKEKSD